VNTFPAPDVVRPLRPRRPGDALAEPAAAATEPAPASSLPAARGLPTLSCVVPCYNEATNLAELLPRLRQTLAGCSRAWEVILVDDGSTDNTSLLAARWADEPGFRSLQLSRNFGKEAALTAGLEAARGEVVVMLDADLQHPPALIPDFVAAWRQGADVVYAVREHRQDEGRFKRLGARWFYRLINAADRFEVPAGAGDFRLMDRAVVRALLSLPERNRFMKGLYGWVGFRTQALPYQPAARASGRSHFSPLRLIHLSLDALTGFTTWPLRAVSLVGFSLAALAFIYGGYLTAMYLLYGHGVSGWTTIVVSLMLFSGIQLVSIGVLGEYLGRVFEEVKARPLYIVRQSLGHGLQDPAR